MPPTYRRLNTLPTIRVQDPTLHQSFTNGKYTSYKIMIETEHHAFHLRASSIRRRYSELRWLCTTLHAHHKLIKLPSIPPKRIFSERFSTDFVDTRMKEIEVFLNELIKIDTALSDSALHMFLQTDLSTSEMDEYLNGEGDDTLLQKVYDCGGHVHTPNELGSFTWSATPREIEMDSEDEMLMAAARSGSTISQLSTDFNNLNSVGNPKSSPKKTIASSKQPTVGGFQPSSENFIPVCGVLKQNSDLPSARNITATGTDTSSVIDDNGGSYSSNISDPSYTSSTDNGNANDDADNNDVNGNDANDNDTASSVVTMSTEDNSTGNSSPAFSEGQSQSSSITTSSSDVSH